MDCQPRQAMLKYVLWRGARAVEGARLESVCAFTRTKGSNPFLSASLLRSNFWGVNFQIPKPPSEPQYS